MAELDLNLLTIAPRADGDRLTQIGLFVTGVED